MKRARAGFLGALALLGLLWIGLRSDYGQDLLRRLLLAQLRSLPQLERVQLAGLRTNLFDRLTLEGLALDLADPAPAKLRVQVLEMHWRPLALLGGAPLRHLQVRGLEIRLPSPPRQQSRRAFSAGSEGLSRWTPASARLDSLSLCDLEGRPQLRLGGAVDWQVSARQGAGVEGLLDGADLRLHRGDRLLGGLRLRGHLQVGPGPLRLLALEIQGDSLQLESRGEYGPQGLEARIQTAAAMAPLQRFWGALPPLSGHLRVALHLAPGDSGAGLQAQGENLNVAGRDLGAASLQARWTAGQLRVDSLEVRAPFGLLAGRANLELEDDYAVRAHLEGRDLEAALLARLFPVANADLQGRLAARLEVQGRLAPGRLQVAKLSLQGQGVRWGGIDLGEADLEAGYRAPHLRAHVRSQALSLLVEGSLDSASQHQLHWRLQEVDLERLHGDLGGRLDLQALSRGALRRPELSLQGEVQQPRWGALQFSRLQVEAHLDSSADFEALLRDPAGALRLEARGNLRRTGSERLRLALHGLGLRQVLAPAVAPGWEADLDLDLELSGGLERPRGQSRLRIGNLMHEGRSLGDVLGVLSAEGGRGSLHLAALDSALTLDGAWNQTEAQMPFALSGRIRRADLAPFLVLAAGHDLPYQGHLSGSLRATGSLLDLGKLRVEIGLEELFAHSREGGLQALQPARLLLEGDALHIEDLRLGGAMGRLHLDGRVGRRGGLELQLEVEDFQLAFLEPFLLPQERGLAGTLNARGRLHGTAQAPLAEGRLRLEGLRYAGGDWGLLSADFRFAERQLHLSTLELELPRGRFRGRGRLPVNLALAGASSPPPAGLEVRVQAEAVQLDSTQGLPPGLQVRGDGFLQVRGPGLDLERLRGELRLRALEVRGGRFVLDNAGPVALRLRAGGLEIENLQLRVRAGDRPEESAGQIDARGRAGGRTPADLHLQVRHLDLEALSRLLALRRRLAGYLDAELSLQGSVQEPHLRAAWQLEEGRVGGLQIRRWQGRAAYAPGALHFEEMRLQTAGGWVAAEALLPLDAQGQWLREAPLHLQVRADSLDLALLPLPHPLLTAQAGRLSLDLNARGSLSALRPDGVLTIENGRFKVQYLDPEFAFARGQVLASDGRFEFRGFSASNSRESWDLKGGGRFSSVLPDTFALAFAADRLLLAMPRTAELHGSGRLDWRGAQANSRLSGHLLVERGRMGAPVNLRAPPERQQAPVADTLDADTWAAGVALDVDIQVRRMLLENDLMESELEGVLGLRGSAARPALRGQIAAREGGRVFYLGRGFALDRARLHLDQPRALPRLYALLAYPAAIDPVLDIAAHTELKASNGNEYQIALELAGPLSAPDFQLRSDPPRRHVEILSLLSFGRPDVQMVDAQGELLDRQSELQLDPRYLMRIAQTRFQRVLGVDAIHIDTSFFDPRDLGSTRITLTKQLNERAEIIYSTPVGYASRGRVQVHYELDDKLYLQTERDAEGESGLDLKFKLRFR